MSDASAMSSFHDGGCICRHVRYRDDDESAVRSLLPLQLVPAGNRFRVRFDAMIESGSIASCWQATSFAVGHAIARAAKGSGYPDAHDAKSPYGALFRRRRRHSFRPASARWMNHAVTARHPHLHGVEATVADPSARYRRKVDTIELRAAGRPRAWSAVPRCGEISAAAVAFGPRRCWVLAFNDLWCSSCPGFAVEHHSRSGHASTFVGRSSAQGWPAGAVAALGIGAAPWCIFFAQRLRFVADSGRIAAAFTAVKSSAPPIWCMSVSH